MDLSMDTLSLIQDSRIKTLINQFFLQMHILSVSGPVVTAAGYEDQLAIVSHASDCLPSGDQVFVRILICSSVKLNSGLIYVVPKLLYGFK